MLQAAAVFGVLAVMITFAGWAEVMVNGYRNAREEAALLLSSVIIFVLSVGFIGVIDAVGASRKGGDEPPGF